VSQPYGKLWRRMAVVSLVVAVIPLNVLGVSYFYYRNYTATEGLKEELRIRAISRAGAIELFLAERTTLLEVLAHAAPLGQLSDESELASLLQIMNRRSWSFVDLGIVDADGHHRAYVGPYQLKEQNYYEASWFQQVMLTGVYVSDVFLGYRQVPHFVIAIKHDDGTTAWILRATIDSELFTRMVRAAQVGAGGDAYIVNREGRLQTPPRHAGKLLESAPIDMRTVPPATSVIERTTPDGRRVLTAFSWLDHNDWLLVIDQDPNEILGPLNLSRNSELAVLGLASLFLMAAVLSLVRLFIRRLQANDRERAAIDAQVAHSARLVSLGRMAAGVAHEINNPLATISELAGDIQDILGPQQVASLPEGEVVAEDLERIQNQVERARGVTHRMLNFARRMEPQMEATDVNAVVRESYSFIEKEALFNNIKVQLELDPEVPAVSTDRAQLQQVFLNLLDNALDATGKGGRIRITSQADSSWITVKVTDSGPGVPPDLAGRIFDPFFTTKEPGQGTGLGLSISHSIMDRLGGALELENKPGQGATFVVRIPNLPPRTA
jgi:two-component system, NtrC family, sensor kinase